MALIYFFSSQSDSNERSLAVFGDFNYFARKSAHISEYAILFALLSWAFISIQQNFASEKTKWLNKPYLLAFSIAVIYALSDEWHQSFVPGRSSCFNDVLIDTAGIAISYLCFKLIAYAMNVFYKR